MAIGETFLSAFLQVLFQQMLTSGGRQFLEMVGGDDLPKTIKKWEKELTRLEALLDDAELQQFHSKSVKLWLKDLQDLAYDIEDLLDHFATEAQGYKLKKAEEDEANSNAGILDTMMQNICASGSRAADSLSTFLKPVDQNIRDKIDDITERLQYIQDHPQSLKPTEARKMKHQTLQTEDLRSQRESTCLVGEVFGRDKKKQEIITQLLKDEQNGENYVVIPIVGTGGIGKTTLAQYVYNDEQLKGYFDRKAWVCISDLFDVKRITIDMINSATSENFDCSNLDQAQVKLQKVLTGKKFLIVLDDIWSTVYDHWDKLKQPFRHGVKGSRVIMTTRIESIAMMMVTNNPTQGNIIIKLGSLSKDDSWLIFQQHANVDPDLAEMRENILEKINGLPLAAKALGGLLKRIPDKSERRKILESNVWGEKSDVLPVLRLSYYHMPSHLKRVFAYCSVFPKYYRFKERELVLLWMAQGFLPETQNERMEDMGHNYFNDLLSRSLFKKFGKEEFIMHDLIHDVAQLAASDVCYVMDSKSDEHERIRHLFITKHVRTLGKLNMAAQLRTFLCSNYCLRVDNLDIIQRMHYIRTLHLVSWEINVLPDCIGDLKHLRYLRLGFPRVKELPQSINCLLNLQTLCLDGFYKLEKFPYIGSLEKLRHMYIDKVKLQEMPLGIGKLTNLQSLRRLVLAPRGGSRVRELGKLNHLRGILFISGVENVTEVEDAQEAQLHKKECLVDLHLIWGSCTDKVDDKTNRDVIEKLQPHTNIKYCELRMYMGSMFPSWLGDPSFSNMVDIKLDMCDKCKCLPPLGQLPSLRSLRIEKNNSIKEVGLEFYGHCSSPFPSLKTLSIHHMESWEKWVHPDNSKAFPILEDLSIKECPSLQGDLPPHLPSLSHLEIRKCDSMVSIGHIPLTVKLFEIEDCEKLGCVEFDDQPTNLSAGSEDKKALQSEESVEVSQMASIVNCPRLRNFPEGGLPTNLRGLEIRGTNIDKPIKEWGLQFLTSLQKLTLKNVGSCANTIESIGYPDFPSSLCELNISNFQNLKTICCSTLPILESLVIKFASLRELSIVNCPNLEILKIKGCPSLRSLEVPMRNFPEGGLPTNLMWLDIKDIQNLKSISNGTTLPNLTDLSVCDCPNLHNLPGGLPTNLEFLDIRGTNIDKPIKEWGLHFLTSLEQLTLKNVGSCANTIESIGYPDFPSSLSLLNIRNFQNLKTICCSTLPNLSRIYIKCCPKLESFGVNALPPNIMIVNIKECDMIEQHLRSDPNGRIRTENGRFSLLFENQPSSAHSST